MPFHRLSTDMMAGILAYLDTRPHGEVWQAAAMLRSLPVEEDAAPVPDEPAETDAKPAVDAAPAA